MARKVKRIPMNKSDRCQALVRIPQYLQDLQDIKSTSNVKSRREFYKKYKLSSVVVDPQFLEKYSPEQIERAAIFTDDSIAKIMPAGKAKMVDVGEGIWKYDTRPFLREGRYLAIEIDLSAKKEDITSKINKSIALFSRYVKKPGTRYKEGEYSPWEVYKMHEKEGKNFSEIARKLSGLEGNPSYSSNLMAAYKKVKRAYEKARKMIKQVEKDIKLKKPTSHFPR